EALARLVGGLRFEPRDGGGLAVDGTDVSAEIRRVEAGELASRVSTRPVVRERLVARQRARGARGGAGVGGRDIRARGVPSAAVKPYLTADPAERARRRAVELRRRGESVDEAALAREIAARDERDSARSHSPLRPAADALRLDTTGLTLEQVVARMEQEVVA